MWVSWAGRYWRRHCWLSGSLKIQHHSGSSPLDHLKLTNVLCRMQIPDDAGVLGLIRALVDVSPQKDMLISPFWWSDWYGGSISRSCECLSQVTWLSRRLRGCVREYYNYGYSTHFLLLVTCKTWHFLGWNSINQSLSHKAFRCCWSLMTSTRKNIVMS